MEGNFWVRNLSSSWYQLVTEIVRIDILNFFGNFEIFKNSQGGHLNDIMPKFKLYNK